mmetsp:Transcript_16895/g.53056  ORF Transcript_16895/g.53056 Transcript_16895/m.53056 type:complete len:206 (+) Transcript_16895:550-1167(+)
MRHERGHGMIPEATGVDGRRHEGRPQRVGLDQRRHLCGVPEVVGVDPLRQGGARRRLHRDDAEVLLRLTPELLPQEGEGNPSEVGAAARAPHDNVRVLPQQVELVDGLKTDHSLVHQHVAEHAAERVLGLALRGDAGLDGLGDGDPERAGALGVLREDLGAHARLARGRGVDDPAAALDEGLAVGLLLVAAPHLVDLDGHVELRA